MSRYDELEARVAELERRLAERRGGRSVPALAAALVLAALSVPLAIAGERDGGQGAVAAGNARGEAVQIGVRNRSDRETGLIANSDGYALRLSNVNRSRGGGAVFGCRAASGREACLYGDNLAGGQAFLFRSRGSGPVGRIEATDASAAPFTTNATGVAAGLNADKVDGLDADALRGQQGPPGPTGPQGPAGPAGPPAVFAAASQQEVGDVDLDLAGKDLIETTLTTSVETRLIAMATIQLESDGLDNDQAICRLRHNDGDFANGQILSVSVPDPAAGDPTAPLALVRSEVVPAGQQKVTVNCNDAFGVSNVNFAKGDLVVWAVAP